MHDPIEFPRRYKDGNDIETVAFISALFAYGRVVLFKSFLERVFGVMGESPYSFITHFKKKTDGKYFKGFKYRFNDAHDLIELILLLKHMLIKRSTIGSLFTELHKKNGSIRSTLIDFIDVLHQTEDSKALDRRGFRHLLPSPVHGSPCKRLNMFLRWMVRDSDIDFGLWKEIPKNKLIIPLDTHIARIGRCLGLTERRSADWKTAEEITESLKMYDRADPLKYDFVLCHQGISGLCREDRRSCDTCDLKRQEEQPTRAQKTKNA